MTQLVPKLIFIYSLLSEGLFEAIALNVSVSLLRLFFFVVRLQ